MKPSLDRRSFSKRLASGLAAAPLVAMSALPTDAAAAEDPPPKEEEHPRPSVADLWLEQIKLKYPQGLTDDHLAEIRGQLESHAHRSRLLSGFPLTNADEPAFRFVHFRADE